MNERTRKILIVLTLPAAIIWAVFNIGDDEPQVPVPAEIPAMAVPIPAELTVPVRSTADYEAHLTRSWGADPFQSDFLPTATGQPSEGPVWKLGGIIYSATSPLAYVNRTSVRVGDTIDKARVVAIDRKTVTLEYKGREYVLSVDKG